MAPRCRTLWAQPPTPNPQCPVTANGTPPPPQRRTTPKASCRLTLITHSWAKINGHPLSGCNDKSFFPDIVQQLESLWSPPRRILPSAQTISGCSFCQIRFGPQIWTGRFIRVTMYLNINQFLLNTFAVKFSAGLLPFVLKSFWQIAYLPFLNKIM